MQTSVIQKAFLPTLILVTGCLTFGYVQSAEPPKQAEVTEQSVNQNPNKQNPNKKVCKKIKTTGSHFSKRVCMKQKEWDEIGKNARKTMRDMTTDNRGSF